jgi:uncharacterized SAM-binding protein YcdF (DUF218 family)
VLRASLRRTSGSDDRIDIGRDGVAIFGLTCLLILASGGITYILSVLHVVREAMRSTPAPPSVRSIVVLGMMLRGDGDLAPAYRQRLDCAAGALAGIPDGRILVLGGVTRAGLPSEADAGMAYLVRYRNVPLERIGCERRSRHTLENLRFCKAAMADEAAPILLVTNRFHMARARLASRGLGLTAWPCPSDGGVRSVLRLLARTPLEGLLIHWYVTGRTFARVTRNARMMARIS